MRNVIQQVMEAEAEAKRMVAAAEEEAEGILANARREAQQILEDGRREACAEADRIRDAADADGARELLEGVAGVREVAAETRDAATFRITVTDGPQRLAELIERVRALGVREVTLHRPSLGHVFLHHTGHRFEEADA